MVAACNTIPHAQVLAFLDSRWSFRTRPTCPCLLSHLLGVVDEGIVGVDKEDVLGLQVSVSQLVVMENCGGDRGKRCY